MKNGRPESGPLYEDKKNTKKLVKQRILHLQGIDERKRIAKMDSLFESRANHRFRMHKNLNPLPIPKLRIGEKLVCDIGELLCAWSDHFQNLSVSD